MHVRSRRLIVFFGLLCSPQMEGQVSLPPWQEGYLDFHHVSTGRGNATFCIFPDGTTLLVDAGETSDTHPRTRSPRQSRLRPDSSRSAAEWLVDYIRQFHPKREQGQLDYALITHFHDDHFGEWDETRPLSRTGKYRLTGITAVGEQVPIKVLLDRGWLSPIDLRSKDFAEAFQDDPYRIVQTLQNYWAFVEQEKLLRYDSVRVGAADQIVLRYRPSAYPVFRVHTLAAGGRIWTGFAEGDYLTLFEPGRYPGENPLSVCLKISYGPFDYFAGGDISGLNAWGEADFNSVEAHLGPVVGPVDVATLNHHGNRDAMSAYFVRCLRPRVWVQQVWSSDHPGHDVLRRITSPELYPGARDLFATDMTEANRLVIGDQIASSYKYQHGHIVVRVEPGGRCYWVYVLNDYSSRREVLDTSGPYFSR